MLFFLVLFILGWPQYQYLFDVDGIGYASVADHYAAGDLVHAINAFWSPLHSWLIVPFVKAGVPAYRAFKASNAVISLAILALGGSLAKPCLKDPRLGAAFQFTLAIFLLHAAYNELAADLLCALFLLAYLRVLSSERFFGNIAMNVLAGCLGALAYLSKAYAFGFFLLHFTLAHVLLNQGRKRWVLFLYGIGAFLMLCLPWLLMIHHKYGFWSISTSGRVNMSIYLHPEVDQPETLLAPTHAGSPGWLEERWYAQRHFFTPFSSMGMFLHEIRVILYNIQQWLSCLFSISFLAPAILFACLLRSLRQRERKDLFFLLAFLVLPAGYLLIHIEPRFLWALVPLFMVYGAGQLDRYLTPQKGWAWVNILAWTVFFGSFLVEPVNQLHDSRGSGVETQRLAAKLKQEVGPVRFTSNDLTNECQVAAYLAGSSYYELFPLNMPLNRQLEHMQEQQVTHYLFFYRTEEEKGRFLHELPPGVPTTSKDMGGNCLLVRFSFPSHR
jgi:hypothetical protein